MITLQSYDLILNIYVLYIIVHEHNLFLNNNFPIFNGIQNRYILQFFYNQRSFISFFFFLVIFDQSLY